MVNWQEYSMGWPCPKTFAQQPEKRLYQKPYCTTERKQIGTDKVLKLHRYTKPSLQLFFMLANREDIEWKLSPSPAFWMRVLRYSSCVNLQLNWLQHKADMFNMLPLPRPLSHPALTTKCPSTMQSRQERPIPVEN